MGRLTEDTVRAAREGDAEALSAVYDSLAPQVRGYLLARGSDDPDGVTHEVFIQVLQRIGSVSGGASGLRALVFSVAHARLVDELRQRSRRGTPVGYDPETDPRATDSAEHTVVDATLAPHLEQGLGLLSEDQRSVVLLRAVGQLSEAETAVALDRSVGSVKQLYRRALARLRTGLESGELAW